MKEADITRSIRKLLNEFGVFHWKQHQGLGSTPGIPDIIGIYQGRLIGIEVKAPGGRLSEAQEKVINQINKAGGVAFTAHGIEDVI